MKAKTLFIAALAAALSTGSLLAQERPQADRPGPAGPQGERAQRPVNPLIAALDANGNRTLEAEEINNAPRALERLASQHGGQITLAAIRPVRPDTPQPPADAAPRPPRADRPEGAPRAVNPLFAALDANTDGVIDAQEIRNASAAIRGLDRSGDGSVTRDEMRPERRQPEAGAGGTPREREARPPRQPAGTPPAAPRP